VRNREGVFGVQPPISTKPYRRVILWQAVATAVLVVVCGLVAGVHGALSALLGGVVNMSAGVVYAFMLAIGRPQTAGDTVVALFRAEASKIVVIIVQLWLVLTTYQEIVVAAFLAAFIITVLLFRVALFVRD
jgi:ATP synthase protein I